MFEYEKNLFRYVSNDLENEGEHKCELLLCYGKDNPDFLMERHYYFFDLQGSVFYNDYRIVIKSNKGGYSFYKVEYNFDGDESTVKGELYLRDIKDLLELFDSISNNVDMVSCINNSIRSFGYRVEKVTGEMIILYNPQDGNRITINRNGVIWTMLEEVSDELNSVLKEIYGYLYEGDDVFIEDNEVYDKITVDEEYWYEKLLSKENQYIELYKEIIGNDETYLVSNYPRIIKKILDWANNFKFFLINSDDKSVDRNIIYSYLSLLLLTNNLALENNVDESFVITLKELNSALLRENISRCECLNYFIKLSDMSISDNIRKSIFDILVSRVFLWDYAYWLNNKYTGIEWRLLCDLFYRTVEKYELDPTTSLGKVNLINHLERIVEYYKEKI